MPPKATKILYEGTAHAFGDRVRLPVGTSLGGTPAMVRIFDPAKIVGMAKPKPNDHDIHFKIGVRSKVGRDAVTGTG